MEGAHAIACRGNNETGYDRDTFLRRLRDPDVMCLELFKAYAATESVFNHSHDRWESVLTLMDDDGRTAAHHLANNGDALTLEHLVNWGEVAELNQRDADGWSPLHYAARNGNRACANLLIEAAAHHGRLDLAATDYKGRTALDVAFQHGHADVVVVLMKAFQKLRIPFAPWQGPGHAPFFRPGLSKPSDFNEALAFVTEALCDLRKIYDCPPGISRHTEERYSRTSVLKWAYVAEHEFEESAAHGVSWCVSALAREPAEEGMSVLSVSEGARYYALLHDAVKDEDLFPSAAIKNSAPILIPLLAAFEAATLDGDAAQQAVSDPVFCPLRTLVMCVH